MMLELVIHNVRIADVITQQLYWGWLSIQDGRFIHVEQGDLPEGLQAKTFLDADGYVLQPGLLDVHMHIESSLVTPRRFAEAALPWGTTTILQDPHEVANVLGAAGIRWMIEASQKLPLRIYSAISSCVPATSSAIETPNASLTPADVLELSREPDVIALGEMMDYQAVVEGDAERLAILAAGKRAALSLEGHVPSLSGQALSQYIAAGIRSDHTLMTPNKVLEELRKGLYVMLQEKSLTADVIDTVSSLSDRSRIILITDDVMPNRLRSGHMSRIVDLAVSQGWSPLDALASASLRPAMYLGLNDTGAIAPGYKADFLLCQELNQFAPEQVYVAGHLVAEKGKALDIQTLTPENPILVTRFAQTDIPGSFFEIVKDGVVKARVIEVNQINSFTTLAEEEVGFKNGIPEDKNLCLAVVIARGTLQHPLPKKGAVCLIRGFGLKSGAYATTFAHDSHNVFILGRSPEAMRQAAKEILNIGGGMTLLEDAGDALTLPLPLAGLLSDEPVGLVGETLEAIEAKLKALGVGVKNPILMLTLLPLSVSPAYKVTDKGIVDVEARQILAPVVSRLEQS